MRETIFSRFWKSIVTVFRSPLGRRQIITTFMVVLLPVILLSAVIYVRNRNQAQDNSLDTLNALAAAQQTSVTSYVENLQKTFALAASSAELRESTLVLVESPRSTFFIRQVNDILEVYGGPGRSFDSIGVYSLDGQLLAGVGNDNFENPAELQEVDTFISAVSGISVSPPFFDADDEARAELYVAIPVLDELSDTRAILLGVADLTDLNILLRENLGLGESEHIFLVSREGYFLTDAHDQLVAEQTAPAISTAIEHVLEGESGSSRYLSHAGVDVLGAYHWIPEIQAAVIAEVDAEEVLPTPQELIQSVLPVTGISLAVAFAVAIFATMTVVRPVMTLTNTAKRIAAGNFGERVPRIGAGEMNTLAETFNQMSAEIQGLVENLEVRVIERTKDLEATLEVGRITTTLFGQAELLTQTAEFIRERFGLYYVQIYLLDEAKRYAVLRAGTGDAGRMLLDRGHRLNLNETSIVAQTVQLLRPVLVVDTLDSTIHKPNPLLPDTRSEVAIPLLVQNELLGVLDMQSTSPGKFNYDNLPAFQAMATQVAGVIRGARALEETRAAVERMNLMNRRLTEAGWQSYMYQLDQQGRVGYQYNLESPRPLPPNVSLVSDEQVDTNKQVKQPIHVRGQKIGALLIEEDHPRDWGEEEIRLIEDVADTVARTLDQMRAFDETQSALNEVALRAIELQTVAELSTEISSTLEIDKLVKNVSDLVKQRFNLYHAHIYLLDEDGDLLVLAGGAGEAGDQMVEFGHAIPAASEYSIVAQAARSRSAVVVNDITEATTFLPNPLLPQTHAEMAIPIMVGNQLLGVLDVQSETVGRFTEKDMQIQSTLANQIAVAVQNARQFAVTQRQLRDLSIGSQISDLIRHGGEQEDLLEKILEKLCEAFEAENAFMSVFSHEKQQWNGLVGVGSGMSTHLAKTFVEPADCYPHAYQAITAGRVITVEDASTYADFPPEFLDAGVKSVMTLPLVAEQEALGVIFLNYTTKARRFTRDETELARSLANLIAVSVERARAEEALRESENRFRSLVSNVPGTIYRALYDEHWTMKFLSDSVTNLTGYPAADFIDNGVRSYSSLILNEDIELVTRTITEAVLAGSPYSVEYRICHTDGSLRWVLEQGQATFDEDGKILWLDGALIDVTERKRSEEEIRRRAIELQTVAEVSTQATSLLDVDSMVNDVSNLTKERFGLYHAHIYLLDEGRRSLVLAGGAGNVGRQMVDLGHAISQDSPFSIVAQAARSRSAVISNDVSLTPNFLPNPLLPFTQSELAIPLIASDQLIGVLDVQADVRDRFVETDVQVMTTLANQIATAIQNARTFHEVEEAEKEIRRRAVEMETVAEVSAQASTSLDVTRLLQSVSDLTKERFGLYHAHIYLMDADEDVLVLAAGAGEVGSQMVEQGHAITVDNPNSIVATAARERRGVVANDVARNPTFLPNPFLPYTRSEMALPMIVGDELIGVLDVQAEYTNRFTDEDVRVQSTLASQVAVAVQNARLYAEQVQTAEQLREVDRLKSEFLASMSHELRTPLNSIIGYAEVILDGIDGPISEDMEEDVSAIYSSGKLLLSLINDILDLAKIESNQLELDLGPLELGPFLSEIVESSRILVKDKQVDLVLEFDPQLDTIVADRIRLQQIMNNLISNAVKFTEQGQISVCASRQDGITLFKVVDTGMGIPADKLDLIFERFRQADQSSTRRAGGTGLGLAITRQLIEMHGGKIWVESQIGRGSTFAFTVPVNLTPKHKE